MHARVKETYRIGSRIPLQRMSDVFRNPSKSCVRPTNGREMCLPLEIEEQRRCRRSASNPVDRLLLHQKLRNNRNLRTHIAAVDDFIHLTVLQQEFGTLETLWELSRTVCSITRGPAKPMSALGSAMTTSPIKAKEAETPPIVGSVSTVMNGRP